MRQRLALTILLSAITLGACGTRGSLYLPPPQTRTPADTAIPQDSTTAKDLVR